MEELLKKLNAKPPFRMHLLNAPPDLLSRFEDFLTNNLETEVKENSLVSFCLLFATKFEELPALVNQVGPKLEGDALLWICYPKGSSKRYKSNFNRDSDWGILGAFDLEPVRQVSIDEDWSALRFRKVDYIKTMTRKFDKISEKGRLKFNQTF